MADPAAPAVAPTTVDGAGATDDPEKPKEYTQEELEEYVKEATKLSAAEKWDEALNERSVGGTKEDHAKEKVFANLMLDKENQGAEGRLVGIKPESYTTGKWYKLLNANASCFVYVHNITRDITAVKPENFLEPTAEELERERKRGVPLNMIEGEIDIWCRKKKIPVIYCTEETQEKIKIFMSYGRGQVIEGMKRVSETAMEKARVAIVTAMKMGTYLVIEVPIATPDFLNVICTPGKWANYFPVEIFQFEKLSTNQGLLKKIYRPDDMEANQCVVRKGFKVCITVCYDNQNLEMSSFRKDELKNQIPEWASMGVIRCRG